MDIITAHEAALTATNNFLPDMEEHKIEELPGETKPETPVVDPNFVQAPPPEIKPEEEATLQ